MGQGPVVSFILSIISVIGIIGTFQYYNSWFCETPMKTVLCGYIGSWLFLFCLSATSSIEMIMFGTEVQAKLFEVIVCLGIAVFACASVHRVCASSCILFSIAGLYFVNKISQKTYNSLVTVNDTSSFKKSGGNKKNKHLIS